jgi:hypothetical protein
VPTEWECIHRGAPTGETFQCGCAVNPSHQEPVYVCNFTPLQIGKCAVRIGHTKHTPMFKRQFPDGLLSCTDCNFRQEPTEAERREAMRRPASISMADRLRQSRGLPIAVESAKIETVDQAREWIGPAAKRAKTWLHSPPTKQAMRLLLDEAAAKEYPVPEFQQERGIVISGGGQKYFPLAYAAIANLRRLGCSLPIELWHLGEAEMTPQWRLAVERLGDVSVVDAAQTGPGARILAGWESKPYSMLYCSFAEVLYLDADNLAASDPKFLFDDADYRVAGAVFWPDLPNGREWIPGETWDTAGILNREGPAFETGQILVNKRRYWRELQVTMHLNEYSDCWYEYVYGDKDTFKLAWHKCGQGYVMPTASRWRKPAIIQTDLQDRPLFYHCVQGKPSIAAGRPVPGLPQQVSDHVVRASLELAMSTAIPVDRAALERSSRALAADIPLANGVVATRALGRFALYCDEQDTAFTPHLRQSGFWEAWVTLAVMRLVQPEWRCVNVGAHFGYYSLLLAQLSGREVVAIEPVPLHCDLLRRSAADNALVLMLIAGA